MLGPAAVDSIWRPAPARGLGAGLAAADRFFDRIYSSAFNPLYRTGTLAALSLAIALVTGVYLLFVYDIARPYESVAGLQRRRQAGTGTACECAAHNAAST